MIHLEFKGIELDGPVVDFVCRMDSAGFEYRNCSSETIKMDGQFASESCEASIWYTPLSRTVCRVSILGDEYTEWELLESRYRQIVDLFLEKYGVPSFIDDSFASPYDGTEGIEMLAVKDGACNYRTLFSFINGTISICITNMGRLLYLYRDKENEVLLAEEEKAVILNDI